MKDITAVDRLEVRAYYSNESGTKEIAERFADLVKEALQNGYTSSSLSVLDTLSGTNRTEDQYTIPKLDTDMSVTTHVIDITTDLSDEDRTYLRFPSEDAWTNPHVTKVDVFTANSKDDFERIAKGDILTELPINAVDIVYVVDNSGRQQVKK
jgi:hypothetical protein